MPLKRTPPQSKDVEPLGHYDSEPNIVSCGRDDDDTNPIVDFSTKISTRSRGSKRKHNDDCKDEFRELKLDMEKLFKATLDAQERKFEHVLASIKELKDDNRDLKETVKYISAQYDDISNKMRTLQDEKVLHLKHIRSLEDKLEILERNQKSAMVEIRNIPKSSNRESKTDLIGIIDNMNKVLKNNIQISDIRDVFRLATKTDTNKPIVVDFNSCCSKDRILDSVRKYNKENKSKKFNTGSLGLGGEATPVYVTEALTVSARRLFYLSRVFARDNNYMYCWTSHGRVFLRKAEGHRYVRIDCEDDLKKNVEK